MAFSPHLLIVNLATVSIGPSSGKITPAKSSWIIRINGITVIAVVVDLTIAEMARARMSAAYVIRKNVIKYSMYTLITNDLSVGYLSKNELIPRRINVSTMQISDW